jgi:Domain of unknown function (DUF4276)
MEDLEMNRKSVSPIGIIAEDISDVLSLHVMINRLKNSKSIGVKKHVGKGCGRIARKCHDWAVDLKTRGCQSLIIVHDRDTKQVDSLYKSLVASVSPCPFNNYVICIPVQELEAWLLADPNAIKIALKLRKAPKVKGNPEHINSPKEHLELLVRRVSNGEKVYIHTEHNQCISQHLNFQAVKKCTSFIPFLNFVNNSIRT